MKKLLPVFFTGIVMLTSQVQSDAQSVNINFSSCPGTRTFAPSSGSYVTNAAYSFTSSDCDGNGFSAETHGTNTRVFLGLLNSNLSLRLDRNATTGTFQYARFYNTAGKKFSLTSLSICPSLNVTQNITIHGYAGGTEVTSTVVAYTATPALSIINVPSSKFTSFTSVDELRFTSDASTPNGVILDNINMQLVSLPVTWTGFDVRQQGKMYNWSWSLGVEENVAYYAPQYSADGTHFKDAGKVNTQRDNLNYTFSSPLPWSDKLFFRVKEVDLDNKEYYSTVVDLSPAATNNSFTVYPNPASQSVNVQWPYTDAKKVTTVIYDAVGKVVRRQTDGLTWPITIKLDGLGKGTYFISGIDDLYHRAKALAFTKAE